MLDNTTTNEEQRIVIYTDGACQGNPGAGGYATTINTGDSRKELTGGYRHTTSNRMELMAVIVALESLPDSSKVVLHSDSKYVIDAMSLGWAAKWKANGWKRGRNEKALNPDLWQRLLDVSAKHDVEWVWVKAHSGIFENERCDHLSKSAAKREDLPEDEGYQPEIIASSPSQSPVRKPANTKQAERPAKTKATSSDIKKFRRTWKLSPEALATLLNTSHKIVANWEVGTAIIPGYLHLALEGLALRLAEGEAHE
jgi:ribonuclease HI